MATDTRTRQQSQSGDVLTLAAERAQQYVRAAGHRKVAPSESAMAALAELHEPFPSSPDEPSEVIAKLDELGSPATVTTTGGRYFGFVNGGMLPAALAANWLAGAWNQNAALRVMSPIAAELEDVAIRWVCEALGLPADCAGGLVTCATMANFTALATARRALLAREGWNVIEDGMFGAPPIEVVVGAEVHASILKALSLAGFGRKRVTTIEADHQGRMRKDKLHRLSKQAIVCIQAGNVNTGAFDPAEEICVWAHEQGAWVHVDGAFGWWARGVELWAALKSRGRSGLRALIERTCAHAQRFAQGLREAGFAVLNDVVINQVLVSFGGPDVTREVIRRIQEDGTCWCAGTVWQGKTAMRISVSSWATTEEDVQRSLAAMIRIAQECRAA